VRLLNIQACESPSNNHDVIGIDLIQAAKVPAILDFHCKVRNLEEIVQQRTVALTQSRSKLLTAFT
jgi:hypothetical protein